MASTHPALAKQSQVLAGATPTVTQCGSEPCVAEVLSPPQAKQHLTFKGHQLTGNDQNASKFSHIRYGTMIWDNDMGIHLGQKNITLITLSKF